MKDFAKASLALFLTATLPFFCMYKSPQERRMELDECIVTNETTIFYSNGNEKVKGAKVFVIGDKYYTACHVITGLYEDRDKFGYLVYPPGLKTGDVTRVEGIVLDLIVKDKFYDLAIFQLPKELADAHTNRSEIDLDSEIKVGDEIFWFGQIKGNEKITKRGNSYNTARIIPNTDDELIAARGFLKTSKAFIVNDSGGPVYNRNNKIVGFVAAYSLIDKGTGFIAPISQFNKLERNVAKP